MLRSLLTVPRLVKQACVGGDDTVAADYPIVFANAAGLGSRELGSDFGRTIQSFLDGIFIHIRLDCTMCDTRSLQHVVSDCTGRGKDQGQRTTLWKRGV